MKILDNITNTVRDDLRVENQKRQQGVYCGSLLFDVCLQRAKEAAGELQTSLNLSLHPPRL